MEPGIRKVAVLVASLDTKAADAVLRQMGVERASEVRRAVGALGPIDPVEQQRVIAEFFRSETKPRGSAAARAAADDAQGVELQLSSVRASEAPRNEEASESRPLGPRGRPFHFLEETEANKLAQVLAGERPQTIALVLSHLSAEQSAHVLARLAPALQVEVVRRLIDLEETDPLILAEVEQALEGRFARQVRMQRRRVAGLSAVSGILKAGSGPAASQILTTLAQYDPRLAEQLSPAPLDFSDLRQFDDAGLAAVFRTADRAIVSLSLVGAAPELVHRFLRRLPPAEAEMARFELEHPGPLRLSDVSAAQAEVAEVARQLVIQGRIRLPKALSAEAA